MSIKKIDGSTLKKIRFLWNRISFLGKKKSISLTAVIIFGAILEIGVIGVFIPFISTLIIGSNEGDPSKIIFLNRNFEKLEITILFILLVIFSGISKLLILKMGTRLAFNIGADFSRDIFEKVISQPYRFHINSNSSAIISVGAKVNTVVYGILMPFINLFSSLIIVVAISITLFIINPLIFFAVSIMLGSAYIVVVVMVKRKLHFNGAVISNEHTELIKVQQETLGSIRDIILDHSQIYFCLKYQKSDLPYRMAMGSTVFISQFPKFILETIGLVLIAGLSYFVSAANQMIVPLLGAIALGAQRLLPAFQLMYSSWTTMIGNTASLDDVLEYLNLNTGEGINRNRSLIFTDHIELIGIGFGYSDNHKTLNNINLKIYKGATIGIIGKTGSGKSTLVDLIMGLILPSEGQILVDGVDIAVKENLISWQHQIAHIPQHIYLADTTIIENIAIGVAPGMINLDLIKRAAEIACAHEFIEGMNNGYHSMIGERGMQLSGGQRQRLGIARAVYKNPSLLVMDEATSALDVETEKKVMKNIHEMKITTLIISHHKEMLRDCDQVLEVKNFALHDVNEVDGSRKSN